MSIDGGMDKDDVLHIYNEILPQVLNTWPFSQVNVTLIFYKPLHSLWHILTTWFYIKILYQDSIPIFYIKVLYQSSQSLTLIPNPVLLFSHRVYFLIHFTINLLIFVSILYCNINSMLARNSALFYLLSYPQFLEHSRSPVIFVE